MNHWNRKLGPTAVWLFAAVTLGVVLVVTKLIPSITGPLSPQAMATIYFVLFGAGATAAVFVTRTRRVAAVGAFGLAGVGLGTFYYLVVARTFESAGGGISTAMGLVFAIAFAVDSLVASIAGTAFGLRLRRGPARVATTLPR